MSKKSRFRGPFDKQHGKRAKALFKSSSHHLYQICWSLPSQLSWKKSLLLTWEILWLLVITLLAKEKYSVFNRDNVTKPIQGQLSQKKIGFRQFLAAFLKCSLSFEDFEKKYDSRNFCISEITDSENAVR